MADNGTVGRVQTMMCAPPSFKAAEKKAIEVLQKRQAATKEELLDAKNQLERAKYAQPPLSMQEQGARLSLHMSVSTNLATLHGMTPAEIFGNSDAMTWGTGSMMASGGAAGIRKGGGTGPVLPRTQSSGVAIQRNASVTFGKDPNQVSHAFRHTDKKGLNRADVQKAIETDLSKTGGQLGEGLNNGRVVVNGVPIDYAAYKFPDGTINVGRITPPR